MIVTLRTQGLQTVAQVRASLEGAASVAFEARDRGAAYGFIAQTQSEAADGLKNLIQSLEENGPSLRRLISAPLAKSDCSPPGLYRNLIAAAC